MENHKVCTSPAVDDHSSSDSSLTHSRKSKKPTIQTEIVSSHDMDQPR